jgi:hypothetical protein
MVVPRLATPTTAVRDSFVEAARDLRDEGWLPDFPVDEVAADFDGYVQRELSAKEYWGVPVTASRRVIEVNGGTLENVLDGECRYWIGTSEDLV